MVIDGRSVPSGHVVDTDVCIAGAGAAGITLAKEFVNAPFRVCVLESGGFEYDPATQSLYAGNTVGQPYFPLDVCRLRYFGGTTNHWGGFCRPLDDQDFQVRDWVPHSGWPFPKSELIPYYERAQVICELGPFAYEYADWEPQAQRIGLDGSCLKARFFQSSPPTRFGRVYRNTLERASNISLHLHTNALEIQTDATARVATGIKAGTLAGNRYLVRAKQYIIALGGIENARLLLLSNRVQQVGLCNEYDLVGRFFMDHPILRTGSVLLPRDSPLASFSRRKLRGTTELAPFITADDTVLREKRLLNFGVRLKKPILPPSLDSLRILSRSLRKGRWPDDFTEHVGNVMTDLGAIAAFASQRLRDLKLLDILYWMEPAPNPNSRITLTHDKDRLGLHRVRLDWQLTELDLHTMHEAHRLLAMECGAQGIGRVKVSFDETSDAWPPHLSGSYHHMGTTRMHVDPKHGVVTPDCRTHQIQNLFIAGSSVFPTAGHANPTLTIVTLAIRLADHIKRIMA